jgi:hypothetical protein
MRALTVHVREGLPSFPSVLTFCISAFMALLKMHAHKKGYTTKA